MIAKGRGASRRWPWVVRSEGRSRERTTALLQECLQRRNKLAPGSRQVTPEAGRHDAVLPTIEDCSLDQL